ncbi:unnamed protein product, partial [Scytosiphon promiscuus]
MSRCSLDSCTKQASFNLAGSHTEVYCEHHADYGLVDVITTRC